MRIKSASLCFSNTSVYCSSSTSRYAKQSRCRKTFFFILLPPDETRKQNSKLFAASAALGTHAFTPQLIRHPIRLNRPLVAKSMHVRMKHIHRESFEMTAVALIKVFKWKRDEKSWDKATLVEPHQPTCSSLTARNRKTLLCSTRTLSVDGLINR